MCNMKIVFLVFVTIFSLPTYAQKIDHYAGCLGVIIGNASFEVVNGDENYGVEMMRVGYVSYLDHLLTLKLPKNEVQRLDQLSGKFSDEVTNKINAKTYGNEDYENLSKCLVIMTSLALKQGEDGVDAKRRSYVKKISEDTIKQILTILKAN